MATQIKAGAVRTFYSPEKDTDRIDVGYHDPRRGQNNQNNMNLGVYHSKSRQRAQNVQPEEDESQLEISGSSSISEESENDGGSQGKKESSVSHPLYPQHRANPFAEYWQSIWRNLLLFYAYLVGRTGVRVGGMFED
ncbi:hypothetical protein EPUS_03652 [Endocarpon pusillum Z07020]|uniref:Uncharacterized protein n=1 Tax=Endocarpon pusillum (strain Z07020 / HMAS-L-300199) TaxID=1263415 RepID=U1HHN8_ENDPU|nr:uncharacterized protein EPUS_03652 [Endocarpon pusillum Z07020]ERF69660.1 hypothetical protein EPUS_03652 [Endocarpon pusillum Z07020]